MGDLKFSVLGVILLSRIRVYLDSYRYNKPFHHKQVLTYDCQVSHGVPGGRAPEVHPAPVEPLVPAPETPDDHPAGGPDAILCLLLLLLPEPGPDRGIF